MKKYLLIILDVGLLQADIFFAADILGLASHNAILVACSLYLMFGVMVAMMLLSTGMLASFKARYGRGVVHAVVMPWSSTLFSMCVIPRLLKERERQEKSTSW